MAIIFLCHANEDKPRVREVHERLKAEGFELWFDETDILPGQIRDQEIRRALKNSDFILIFFSQYSVAQRGYLQREMKLALDAWQEMPEGYIHTIPIRLDACEIPESFRPFEWVDCFGDGGWTRLIRAIQAGVGQRQRYESAYVDTRAEDKAGTAQNTSGSKTEGKLNPRERGGSPRERKWDNICLRKIVVLAGMILSILWGTYFFLGDDGREPPFTLSKDEVAQFSKHRNENKKLPHYTFTTVYYLLENEDITIIFNIGGHSQENDISYPLNLYKYSKSEDIKERLYVDDVAFDTEKLNDKSTISIGKDFKILRIVETQDKACTKKDDNWGYQGLGVAFKNAQYYEINIFSIGKNISDPNLFSVKKFINYYLEPLGNIEKGNKNIQSLSNTLKDITGEEKILSRISHFDTKNVYSKTLIKRPPFPNIILLAYPCQK
jgi:hypothetical protein